MKSQRCVFFDRDGIVNCSPGPGYVERWEDFHFLPGFADVFQLVADLGYLSIVAVWAWEWLDGKLAAKLAPAMLLGMALIGTLFSTYLTFLEPFVVEATCSWCLVSAVCITLLLLLVTRRGWRAVRRLIG